MPDHFEDFDCNLHAFTSKPNFMRKATSDFMKAFKVLTGFNEEASEISELAINGNRELLIERLEPLLKHDNWGFNKLHLDALKLKTLTEKYHTASITKKSTVSNLTPLHFACLNPHAEVVEQMLQQNSDFNITDSHNQKPIHYAAICSQPGPLKVLLEKGASVFDVNTLK
jgi:ankyrin repeat protein